MSEFIIQPSNEGFFKNEQGFYLGIPDTKYHGHKPDGLASNSLLKNAMVSNSKLHLAVIEPQEPPTLAQMFGTAYHLCLLEPDLFDEKVTEAPDCIEITGKGERCPSPAKWINKDNDPYCGRHNKKAGALTSIGESGLTMVSHEDYEKLLRMRDAAHAHPSASELLGGSFREGVGMWGHPVEMPDGTIVNVDSKCKIDHISEIYNGVVDIKTTLDASREGFVKSIYKWNYFTQGPMYINAMNALGKSVERFIIIAQEKTDPFDLQVFMLDEYTMNLGQEVLHTLYQRFVRYLGGDHKGYSDEVSPISLSGWDIKQLEENFI